MDVAATFPSVEEKCLMQKMRKMEIDEDLVEWTSSFSRGRRVRMAIDGKEEEGVGLQLAFPGTVGLTHPFRYMHQRGLRAVEGEGRVDSLSFVDVARGGSVAEVRRKLVGAVRRAIDWSRRNGAAFETGKTGAFLFSRNRRHWKDRDGSGRPHEISSNRNATRWCAISLKSEFRFAKQARQGVTRAGAAERRLRSIVTRHGALRSRQGTCKRP